MAKHKGALLDDIAWAKSKPIFRVGQGNRDAGPTMVNLVGWRHKLLQPSGTLSMKFAEKEKEWEALYKHDLENELSESEIAEIRSIDFSWMKDLQEFDHWSLTSSWPLEKNLRITRYEAPIPNFILLMRLSVLRLYRGQLDDDLDAAIAEVLHIARLSLTTETLLGSMAGASIMAKANGFAPGASPIKKDELMRVRRVFFAISGLWSFMDSDQDRRDILKASKGFIGTCVAFGESGYFAEIVRQDLSNKRALLYADLDSMNADACSNDHKFFIDLARANPDTYIKMSDTRPYWSRLPFTAESIALIGAAAAVGDWRFKFYEPEPTKAKAP